VTKETLENLVGPPLMLIVILAVSMLLLRLVPDASASHDAQVYAQGACEGDGNGHMLLDGGCLK
jgi:hypothetical protein